MGVEIEKIHEFSDQAPQQYKSCTVFNDLSESGIPIIHHFFCSRHGKADADRCAGCFKCWAFLEVLSEELVLIDVERLAKHAANKLDNQPKGTECKHNRKKIFYHHTIERIDVPQGIRPIPETRKIHAVRSTGIDGVVEYRKFDCCCRACMSVDPDFCKYPEYSDEWQVADLIGLKRKRNKKFHNLHWNAARRGIVIPLRKNFKKSDLIKASRDKAKGTEDGWETEDEEPIARFLEQEVYHGPENIDEEIVCEADTTDEDKPQSEEEMEELVYEDDNTEEEQIVPQYDSLNSDSDDIPLEKFLKRSSSRKEERPSPKEEQRQKVSRKEERPSRKKEQRQKASRKEESPSPKEEQRRKVSRKEEPTFKEEVNPLRKLEIEFGITDNRVAKHYDWKQLYETLILCETFESLKKECEYNRSKIPPFSETMVKKFINHEDEIDQIAQYFKPTDIPQDLIPVVTEADGNCFPRAVSRCMFGTEERHLEIRMRIVLEAVVNKDIYLDKKYLCPEDPKRNMPLQFAMYSGNWQQSIDSIGRTYEQDTMKIVRNCAYMGIWQYFQVSNVILRPVMCVYPMKVNPFLRRDMHRVAKPYTPTEKEPIVIMWTPFQLKDEQHNPNHFVPMFRKIEWY